MQSVYNAVFGVHRAKLKNLCGTIWWVHLVNMLEHTIHGSNHTIMYYMYFLEERVMLGSNYNIFILFLATEILGQI